MVAQLVVFGFLLLILIIIGLFYFAFACLAGVKEIAEKALVASKATSARDYAEADAYSADAAMSRELTKADAGPAVVNTTPQNAMEQTYTTPDGKTLTVLRPFL